MSGPCVQAVAALSLALVAVPAHGFECAATGATELVRNIDYCADSALASQSGNSYGPANLFDGDRGTAWCEGVPGAGEGQIVALFIENGVPFDRLLIWNGYQKSETSFQRNGRVKRITVSTGDGSEKSFRLPDTTKQIAVNLGEMAVRNEVYVEIREVYPGSRYQDTCISGLFADLESGRDYEPETVSPPVSAPSGSDSDVGDEPVPDLREIAPLPALPGL